MFFSNAKPRRPIAGGLFRRLAFGLDWRQGAHGAAVSRPVEVLGAWCFLETENARLFLVQTRNIIFLKTKKHDSKFRVLEGC